MKHSKAKFMQTEFSLWAVFEMINYWLRYGEPVNRCRGRYDINKRWSNDFKANVSFKIFILKVSNINSNLQIIYRLL